jgi:hypothetical protein
MCKTICCLYFIFCLPIFADIGSGEGFAIYMLANHDVKTTFRLKLSDLDLNKLDLEKSPLINMKDIISYSESEHTILLTKEADMRMTPKVESEYQRCIFALCVDKKPVYLGRFWSDFSSQSCPDVVLIYRRADKQNGIVLQTGYPSPSFFVGRDPRSDERILKSLRDSGKLEK